MNYYAIVMDRHEIGTGRSLLYPIDKLIGKYLVVDVGNKEIAGRMDRIEEEFAVFNPFMHQEPPSVHTRGPAYFRVADTEHYQRVSTFLGFTVLDKATIDRLCKFRNRLIKKS